MSRHEGVSCDSCMRTNFRGKRYKCLVCYDYDLCETCYESSLVSNTRTSSESNRSNHTSDHAMQCMLTQLAYDLFYTGETNGTQTLQSITCPICGSLGFTEGTLITHVSQAHPSHSHEVVCPLCATLPNGDPNFVTEDYARHLARSHNASRSTGAVTGNGEEERASANNVGISFRRRGGAATGNNSSSGVFHSGRAILRRRNGGVLNLTSSNSATTSVGGAGNPQNAGGSNASSGLSTQTPATSANVRESVVDPIAELLSQLSGVRRAGTRAGSSAEHQAVLNSTASHLQQLQWQLQMERQNLSSGGGGGHPRGENLSRIPRRSYGASSYSTQSSMSNNAQGGATEVTSTATGPAAASMTSTAMMGAGGGGALGSGHLTPLFSVDLLTDSRFMLRNYNSDHGVSSETEQEITSDNKTGQSDETPTNEEKLRIAESGKEEKLDFVQDLAFSLLQLDAGDPGIPLEFKSSSDDESENRATESLAECRGQSESIDIKEPVAKTDSL